jgi:hypothetical protein
MSTALIFKSKLSKRGRTVSDSKNMSVIQKRFSGSKGAIEPTGKKGCRLTAGSSPFPLGLQREGRSGWK